jgi:hypothetical protein
MPDYKFYKKGNYIIIIDENETYIEEASKNVLVTKKDVTSTKYSFILKSFPDITGVEFTEILDESGAQYSSQAVWETFYTSTTGGFNAATGGSVASVVESSSTSTTDVLIDNMTLPVAAGAHLVSFNSQYKIQSGNITGQCAIDYEAAYVSIMNETVTDSTHAATFGSGETLTAGVYSVAGAGSLAGVLTLNAEEDADALFILRFGAAFTTGASSSVVLSNGASADNVYFVSEGAIALGATTTMKGILFAHNGAVNLGATCNLNGKMLTNLGAIGIDSSVITSTSNSHFNLGLLSTFAMFTSSGAVTNANASNITGNIGTNLGTVSGFGAAIVNGTIYLPGVNNNAKATFSIYANGVQIASTERVRELEINSVDITLLGLADLAIDADIEVRYRVDAGTVLCNNRVLTSAIK